MVKYIFKPKNIIIKNNKDQTSSLVITDEERIHALQDVIKRYSEFTTYLEWKNNTVYNRLGDETSQITDLFAKTKEDLIRIISKRLIEIIEFKTWKDLLKIMEILEYDQDEYFSVKHPEALIYPKSKEQYFYTVDWTEGGVEGYYANVYLMVREERSDKFILWETVISGKYWDPERSKNCAILLRQILDTLRFS